jgi:hypothetical protein
MRYLFIEVTARAFGSMVAPIWEKLEPVMNGMRKSPSTLPGHAL